MVKNKKRIVSRKATPTFTAIANYMRRKGWDQMTVVLSEGVLHHAGRKMPVRDKRNFERNVAKRMKSH